MDSYVPEKIFFTRGVGRAESQLKSFEEALRDAGIAPYNLISVSSIFPPNAALISREEGSSLLKPARFCSPFLLGILPMNSTGCYQQP